MKHNHQVNLSLQVVPINTTDSYPIIDRAIEAIQESGVKHLVGPFSTSMEGSLSEIMEVVERAKNASLAAGAGELVLNIQVHLKAGEGVFMEEKVRGEGS
jgi:uncharacterized protein YqgV (UPF0045/DUF77 family)